MALLAASMVPVAMMVTPVTASASSTITNVSVGEAFGGQFCIGADNVNSFTDVVERDCPGRKLDVEATDSGFVKLRFHLDTSQCVAAANNFSDVVIHPCDGMNTNWILVLGANPQNFRLINDQATKHNVTHTDQYLTGRDRVDSQFFLTCDGCASGGLQQFTLR